MAVAVIGYNGIGEQGLGLHNNRVIVHQQLYPSPGWRSQTVNVGTAVTEYLKRHRDEAINDKVKLVWLGINN